MVYPVGNVALVSSLINAGEKRGVSSWSAASEIAAAYAGSFGSVGAMVDDAGVVSAGVNAGVDFGVTPLLRMPLVWGMAVVEGSVGVMVLLGAASVTEVGVGGRGVWVDICDSAMLDALISAQIWSEDFQKNDRGQPSVYSRYVGAETGPCGQMWSMCGQCSVLVICFAGGFLGMKDSWKDGSRE